MINLNYDEIQDFSTIADGTYETVITDPKFSETKNGAQHIDIRLTIRRDFEQKHKGQIIFHKIWKLKTTDDYNKNEVLKLAKAAGLPQGANYKSWGDILKALEGRPVKVTVKTEPNTYNGETRDQLNIKKLEASNLAPIISETTLDINDADLPF